MHPSPSTPIIQLPALSCSTLDAMIEKFYINLGEIMKGNSDLCAREGRDYQDKLEEAIKETYTTAYRNYEWKEDAQSYENGARERVEELCISFNEKTEKNPGWFKKLGCYKRIKGMSIGN